jgi:perosamine synthetase
MIPIYRPYLPKNSLKYAHEALDSTWLSHGPYLNKVTEKLQDLLGVKYILPVNNGTSACHLMAKAHYYKHPHEYGKCWERLDVSLTDERFLIPNNVYVAAWNAFFFDDEKRKERVHKYYDADIDTWNMSMSDVEADIEFLVRDLPKTRVTVLVVHNIGNIINVPELKRKYPSVTFLEDNCEGFLGRYEGKYTGTESFASAISFFGNKNITCGEGGAVICQDQDTYEYLKCVHGQGQSSTKFVHSHLGYNYRMTNIQAAILYGQLELLPEILDKKAKLFETYRSHFKNRDDILCQKIDPNTEHSNWMFGVRVIGSTYAKAEQFFRDRGVEARPMFYPISSHKYIENHGIIFNSYEDTVMDLEANARLLNKECIILPSFPELSQEEVKHVLKTVDEYAKQI